MLLRQCDVVYGEDLQVRSMLRNRYLAKSVSDAGWAACRSILTFKAACAGKRVVAVPAHYTTQDCSGCGQRVQNRSPPAPMSVSLVGWS